MTNVYAYHYNCWLTNNSFLGYIGYQSHSYIQGQRVVFEWVQGFVLLLTCLDEFKCSRKDPAPPPQLHQQYKKVKRTYTTKKTTLIYCVLFLYNKLYRKTKACIWCFETKSCCFFCFRQIISFLNVNC